MYNNRSRQTMCGNCWDEHAPTVKVMLPSGARKRLCPRCMVTEGAVVTVEEGRRLVALARRKEG